MKNIIRTIKWLTILPGEKLVRALLMLGIVTIFTLFLSSQAENKKLRNSLSDQQELRRLEILKRTDSFNIVIQTIKNEYSAKYEKYLEEQLEKINKANREALNTMVRNAKIIKRLRNGK